MEISEFDEQASTKEGALLNYQRALLHYYQGEESMGVVDGYELAARKLGATTEEICKIVRICRGNSRGC